MLRVGRLIVIFLLRVVNVLPRLHHGIRTSDSRQYVRMTVLFLFAQAIFASSGGGGEKKDEVDKAVEALVEGARKYRRKYNRPPVLVLDDVDRCRGEAETWSQPNQTSRYNG